ncbi:hypothetical protein GCM10008967_42020 [Bacillus carboniphilus]|uniref:Uncharacterized protein n=1 Tax=Bacillus carboniphilus TaxID=86663 RepID=A0ABP3GLF3_9BACI
MQIERLGTGQYKVFISAEELEERNISSHELEEDQTGWHDNFYDLLEEACDSLGVQTSQNVSVELYSLQPHGIFLILTLLEDELNEAWVDSSKYKSGIFKFTNFEDVVDLSKRFPLVEQVDSSLYAMQDKYWLVFRCSEANVGLYSLISEYGEPTSITQYVLNEYGKSILKDNAFKILKYWFK